jgi:hypothetical protein
LGRNTIRNIAGRRIHCRRLYLRSSPVRKGRKSMGVEVGEQRLRALRRVAVKADLNPRAERTLEGRTSGGHDCRRFSARGRTAAPVGAKLWSRATCAPSSRAGRSGATAREQGPSREGSTTGAEQGPEDGNPTGVTGAKQTRTVLRGESRRGREKRRGRTVAGVASPR